MLIRNPQVAGSFYPSQREELFHFCRTHLETSARPIHAKAVILPHAGYIYSGRTACRTLSQVTVPQKTILIGPNHKGFGSDFAVFCRGEWLTPLGQVPVASDLAMSLLECSHDLQSDEEAHGPEHSLEVLIPFLQVKNPSVQIVPLIVGTLDLGLAREVALAIGGMLSIKKEEFLLVISNDMSHYESDDATRKKDRYALDAIENLDAEALVQRVKKHRITMCGFVPVYMLLVMKEALGIKSAALIDYTTSAEATGDTERVVGYAGFIFE